jgi:hypothetical protein
MGSSGRRAGGAGFATDLRQVRLYLSDQNVRKAHDWVAAVVSDDQVRLLVGHSLGTVVAYEALCVHPEWPMRALGAAGDL